MLVLEGRTEDGILPVGADSENRRVGIDFIRIGDFAYGNEIVVELRILAEVHHIQTPCLLRDGEHSVVIDLRISGLTALCGDEHDTVRTLCTVNRCCGGILEDFHAYNVGRVEGGER